MKNILTTIVTLFMSVMLFAQPTLTEANVGYQPGLNYNYETVTYPTPITTGANHTWNFGSLTSTATTTYNFVNPSTLTQGSTFPTSNVAYVVGGQSEQYYVTSSTKLDLVGLVANGNVFNYSNPETWMQYPFTFGNSFTDDWACVYTNGVTFNRGGTTTVTADGYGSITLPNGTYNNVLRVKLEQDYADTVGTQIFFSYTSENYMWFLPGVHGFGIATRGELNATSTGGTQTVVSGGYLNPIWPTSAHAIKTLDNFIDFYPNPATDALNVKLGDTGKTKLVLTSLNGSKVLEQILQPNASTTVDVSQLSNGNYLLHLNVDGKNVAGELLSIKR